MAVNVNQNFSQPNIAEQILAALQLAHSENQADAQLALQKSSQASTQQLQSAQIQDIQQQAEERRQGLARQQILQNYLLGNRNQQPQQPQQPPVDTGTSPLPQVTGDQPTAPAQLTSMGDGSALPQVTGGQPTAPAELTSPAPAQPVIQHPAQRLGQVLSGQAQGATFDGDIAATADQLGLDKEERAQLNATARGLKVKAMTTGQLDEGAIDATIKDILNRRATDNRDTQRVVVGPDPSNPDNELVSYLQKSTGKTLYQTSERGDPDRNPPDPHAVAAFANNVAGYGLDSKLSSGLVDEAQNARTQKDFTAVQAKAVQFREQNVQKQVGLAVASQNRQIALDERISKQVDELGTKGKDSYATFSAVNNELRENIAAAKTSDQIAAAFAKTVGIQNVNSVADLARIPPAEYDALGSSGSALRRVGNYISNLTKGVPSSDTLNELSNVADRTRDAKYQAYLTSMQSIQKNQAPNKDFYVISKDGKSTVPLSQAVKNGGVTASTAAPQGASDEVYVDGKLTGHVVSNKYVPLGQ